MRVIFLNLNHGLNGIAGIIDFIDQNLLSTDVFCFQEIDKDIESAIDRTLADFNSNRCHKYIKDYNGIKLKTYVNKKFKNIEFRNELFDNSNQTPIAQLSIKTDVEYNIFNFHGWHLPGTKLDTTRRLKMSKSINKLLNQHHGRNMIGGDFNLLPETQSILMIEKNEYFDLIKKFNIDTTRNENAWRFYPNDKQYFADYVFVSKNCKVKNFEVPKNLISDHLPMIVELDD